MKSPTLTPSILAASLAAVIALAPGSAQAGSAAYNALVDSQARVHLGLDETSGTTAYNTATLIPNTNAQSTTLTNDYVYGTSVTLGVASLAGLGTAVQNNAPGDAAGYLAYLNKDYEVEADLYSGHDFTIELWFNGSTTVGRQDLFSTNGGGLFINTNGAGSIQFYEGQSIASNAGAFSDNTWNLIDIVSLSGTITIYLNGTAMASGSADGTTFRDPYWGNLIGANLSPNPASLASNFQFSGALDEFAIYDRALTTGEMAERVSVAAVPEPSTWAMLVGGLGMLALGRHARRLK